MKKVFLIDGSGYIFRAFYAIRFLTNSKGFPTNGIYGFTQMLLKFIRESNPERAAVIFDTKAPTFRHKMFPEYKANRSAPPEALIPQFPYFRKVVTALGLPLYELDGYEADDLIGTFAAKLRETDHEVEIITGDKDLMQLVQDGVTLWDTMKDKRTDSSGVLERFGVTPAQVIEVQGLSGDSTDNIPGVPGVGEKTAVKLIQEWGTIENVLENAHKIKGKLGEKLRANCEMARLSRELCRIKLDVPIEFEKESFKISSLQNDQIKDLFTELEFTSLLADLVPTKSIKQNNYKLVQTENELSSLVESIKKSGEIAVDTETDSLSVHKANLVGVSIATSPGESSYIPLLHKLVDGKNSQLQLSQVQKILGPILADKNIKKYLHHAKFDLHILQRHGLLVEGITLDTLIASYLCDPASRHGLDDLSQTILHHTNIKYGDVVSSNLERYDFTDVPLSEAKDYAAEDSDVTLQLAHHYKEELSRLDLNEVYANIEQPLMFTLLRMENNGFLVNRERLKELSQKFGEQIKELELEIHNEAGEEFNISSPKQLAKILFEKLGLPGGKKTKTGFSTNAQILEVLALEHKIASLVLRYRTLAKLQSTYVSVLPDLVDPETGRIHTNFNQTVAATGRLSSNDPNMQNIPIRSEEGMMIRRAFSAPDKYILLGADYSQIELRILAHLSNDPILCAAFASGRDIHAETAAYLFEISPETLTKEQRNIGKTINFSVIYGQSAYGLAGLLHIKVAEADAYIKRYLATYAKVAEYREQVLEQARKTGEVRTLYGRRRAVSAILSEQVNTRAESERIAFNTVVQGTAADIIKLAMLDIDSQIMNNEKANMILQIHDELIFEVSESYLQEIEKTVRKSMEGVKPPTGSFSVPFLVEISVGKTWADL